VEESKEEEDEEKNEDEAEEDEEEDITDLSECSVSNTLDSCLWQVGFV